MFGKSLKYEFRAVARRVIPLFLTVLAISVIIALVLILAGRVLPPAMVENSTMFRDTLEIAQVFLLIGLYLMIFASGIAVIVMTIRRFYTSFFTDEGYLTFTLPVSVDCHLMTKIVSAIIWSVLGSLVICLSFLVIGGGALVGYGAQADFWEMVSGLFRSLGEVYGALWREYPGQTVLLVIYAAVSALFQIMLIYFGISLGCMVTKKHRVIVSILCIMGVNVVFSILEMFLTVFSAFFSVFITNEVYDIVLLISLIVLCVIKILLCYLGTKAILIKKLNLD